MAFLMDEYFLKIHGRVAVLHPYKKGGILSGKPALQGRLFAKASANRLLGIYLILIVSTGCESFLSKG